MGFRQHLGPIWSESPKIKHPIQLQARFIVPLTQDKKKIHTKTQPAQTSIKTKPTKIQIKMSHTPKSKPWNEAHFKILTKPN